MDFWGDVWCGNVPLRVYFHNLYEISLQQKASVREIWDSGGLNLTSRRTLNAERSKELRELQSFLQSINLDGGQDEVIWPFTKQNIFTTKSMYRLLTFGGSGIMKCGLFGKVKFL